mgnify:CR=1 FL=1
MVGQVRIFGQKRTVEITAKNVLDQAALGFIAAVVAKTAAHFTQGLVFVSQVSVAGMVFKTNQTVMSYK